MHFDHRDLKRNDGVSLFAGARNVQKMLAEIASATSCAPTVTRYGHIVSGRPERFVAVVRGQVRESAVGTVIVNMSCTHRSGRRGSTHPPRRDHPARRGRHAGRRVDVDGRSTWRHDRPRCCSGKSRPGCRVSGTRISRSRRDRRRTLRRQPRSASSRGGCRGWTWRSAACWYWPRAGAAAEPGPVHDLVSRRHPGCAASTDGGRLSALRRDLL